jgi:hypothetical protein
VFAVYYLHLTLAAKEERNNERKKEGKKERKK